MPSAPSHAAARPGRAGDDGAMRARPLRRDHRRELTGEIARYLGAVSILLVGAVHAQQYYEAYFSVVPTIGRFLPTPHSSGSLVWAHAVPAQLYRCRHPRHRSLRTGATTRSAGGRSHPCVRRARSNRDRARNARQSARQRVHAPLRLHGVRLQTRHRPHLALRRPDDALSRRLPSDCRAAGDPYHHR